MKHGVVRLLLAFSGIVLWLWLFSCGITIPSIEVVGEIRRSNSLVSAALLRWIVANAFTNTALLSVLCGFLGGLYRKGGDQLGAGHGAPAGALGCDDALRGMVRGFFIFILSLVSSVLGSGEIIPDLLRTTPPQYVKLALVASGLSFIAGLKPELFSKATSGFETLRSASLEDQAAR